jgi:hypothetical protein
LRGENKKLVKEVLSFGKAREEIQRYNGEMVGFCHGVFPPLMIIMMRLVGMLQVRRFGSVGLMFKSSDIPCQRS